MLNVKYSDTVQLMTPQQASVQTQMNSDQKVNLGCATIKSIAACAALSLYSFAFMMAAVNTRK